MFFPERITQIKLKDRVLEIGPGADPHPRSDVLLEMSFDDPTEYEKQFGHDRALATDKTVVFYDGRIFPFADKEFDYVICSHVLEHVPDPDLFLAEIFRVGKRGYFEYPLVYYEYMHNIDAHLNYLKFVNGRLCYMMKRDTPIDLFRPIQAFFLDALRKGYTRSINDMIDHLIEGFEWDAPFPIERVYDLPTLCHTGLPLSPASERPLHTYGPRRLLNEFVKSIRYRHSY